MRENEGGKEYPSEMNNDRLVHNVHVFSHSSPIISVDLTGGIEMVDLVDMV